MFHRHLQRFQLALLYLVITGNLLSASDPTIENSELNESSGIACSTRSNEILFSHNDSGDKPRLFGFDRSGKTVAEISVTGVEALDWEDMCSFERGGKHWLAVGDIGDNAAKRETVAIYVFEEPELKKDIRQYSVPVNCELRVRFPQRATDCEALVYDKISDSLLLLSKETLGCGIFQVAMPQEFLGVAMIVAQPRGRLTIPLVTGADISRDGQQLVICTYGPACLLQRNVSDAQKPWSMSGEAELPFFEVPARKQGEAICFSPDARYLWLTSEHIPTPLIEVRVPDISLFRSKSGQ